MSSKRGPFVYGSYNFVRKNPAIDFARTAIQDSGMSLKEIEQNGGGTVTTLRKWLYKDARNCRHDTWVATIKAAGGDVGVLMPKSKTWAKLPSKGK
jgi:hypothetical protein